MFGRLFKDERNQRGEIMLEASFILVSVIILLMIMMSLAFLFYQKAMMTSVANEIAADVAKNYKFTDNFDMGRNEISINDVKNTRMFRMSFGMKKLERAHQDRSQKYAVWRIGLATLGLNSGEVQTTCDIKMSGIGRAYVEVKVSQKTEFFLSGILEMYNIADKETLFESTAYAECMDPMAYSSTVNFLNYFSNVFEPFNFIGDFYSSLKTFIEKLMG